MPMTTAADDVFCDVFFNYRENQAELNWKYQTVLAFLTLYSIITPLKYNIFENIMENGVFVLLEQSSIFHNIFKSIQNFT